jgi:hypothetical protein
LGAAALLWFACDRPAARPAAPRPDAVTVQAPRPEATEPPANPEAVDPFADVVPPFERAPEATAPRGILDLQTSAITQSTLLTDPQGGRFGVAVIDLAPAIGVWWVLRLGRDLPTGTSDYHLQVEPGTRLELDPAYDRGLVVVRDGQRSPCDLWGPQSTALMEAAASESAYVQLCGGAVLLRKAVSGHRTSKEWVADFLRDRVPGGEAVTSFVKQELMQDVFLRTADLVSSPDAEHDRPAGAPAPPKTSAEARGYLFLPADLEIQLRTEDPQGRMLMGRWYSVKEQPGVFVSALEARYVAAEVAAAQRDQVSPLDDVELQALNYLVALDLDQYDLGFALGTDHPRVGWSERALPSVVEARIPGPDGFADVAPLARTGRIAPHLARRVVASFIGGFKRSHGAFKFGRLAHEQRGSHYGFVEEGVILSALRPGLATAIVWRDGTVELKTWTAADDVRLGEVRYARQNGVPLVERDVETGELRPGALVRNWSEGNWSGSQDRRFRTLRAGLCLQTGAAGRFLIYGYFSSVTSSAMARVFQAYGCDYAMLLDMNALEHTYFVVYDGLGDRRLVHHLDRGMAVLDQSFQGVVVPRFLSYPDNRDFFYVLRKEP